MLRNDTRCRQACTHTHTYTHTLTITRLWELGMSNTLPAHTSREVYCILYARWDICKVRRPELHPLALFSVWDISFHGVPLLILLWKTGRKTDRQADIGNIMQNSRFLAELSSRHSRQSKQWRRPWRTVECCRERKKEETCFVCLTDKVLGLSISRHTTTA